MGGGAGGQGAQLIGASADGDGQGGSRRTNLENMRQTSQIDRVSGRDIGNRDMLILAGSFIPCVMQTAMDSSQPGYVRCIIPRDIYSDNGSVVLLEQGTHVLGDYQTGVTSGKYSLSGVWKDRKRVGVG